MEINNKYKVGDVVYVAPKTSGRYTHSISSCKVLAVGAMIDENGNTIIEYRVTRPEGYIDDRIGPAAAPSIQVREDELYQSFDELKKHLIHSLDIEYLSIKSRIENLKYDFE